MLRKRYGMGGYIPRDTGTLLCRLGTSFWYISEENVATFIGTSLRKLVRLMIGG